MTQNKNQDMDTETQIVFMVMLCLSFFQQVDLHG